VDICAGLLFYKVCPKAMHTLAQRHLQPPNAMPGLTDLGESGQSGMAKKSRATHAVERPSCSFFQRSSKGTLLLRRLDLEQTRDDRHGQVAARNHKKISIGSG